MFYLFKQFRLVDQCDRKFDLQKILKMPKTLVQDLKEYTVIIKLRTEVISNYLQHCKAKFIFS